MTVTTAPRPTDARPAVGQRGARRAEEVIATIACGPREDGSRGTL